MDNGGVRQKRKSQETLLHRRQSPPNLESQQESRLVAAFNYEVQCMEDIGTALGSAPDMMCYLSKEYHTVADSGNDRCWAGSQMGS